MLHTLRDYQQRCLEISLERYRAGVNRQLVVMATGTGKTAVASNLPEHHGFTGKMMFLVHMELLAEQAANAMHRWNPDLRIGVEMAGSYVNMDGLYAPDIIIASVPTLGRKGSDRIKRFNPDEFDCIVQDESHLSASDSFKRVYEHFGLLSPNPNGPLFLGITATPNRSDGKGLRELFDEIIFDMGIQKGIADGWLCDLIGYRVKGGADLDKVHTRAGDLAQNELQEAVNTPERNALIVKEWCKVAWDKRTLCFTVDIQHALDLAAAFQAHGVPARAVWGDDPDRHEKFIDHKAGRFPVLTNCNVASIGYDDPQLECIISASPTKSAVRYIQQIGRGTRIAPGKDACIVLDVTDNSKKHSLVNISTLLGLPKDLDLKGQRFTAAKEQIDRVAREFPTANVQDIKKLDDLKSVAENASLFHIAYPPEVKQLSEFAWRKSADGYMIAVNRELVTVSQDLRGDWIVRGAVNGHKVELAAQNLAGAFNQADRAIVDCGGVTTLLKRDVRWHNDDPTDKQRYLCKILGITIPQGATKGSVSVAIDAKRAQQRRATA